MQEFSEKRDFPRMSVEGNARYRVEGASQTASAVTRDLSGGGLLMWVDTMLPAGSKLAVEIQPGKSITPPLHLTAEVVRCEPREGDAAGAFAVACSITRMFRAEELPEEFP